MRQRVDAHQHFWRPARGDYGWLRADVAALAPIHRDFLPVDLQPLLAAQRIGRTVLVQAAATLAETDFLLELAAANDVIAGVVGWVDISRADSVATLERWARQPKFKALRTMLQDLPDDDWIARAPHADVVRAIIRLNLRFDALVKPQHLAPLLQFVRAWPDLAVVVDHAAKPQLAAGWQADWVAPWQRGLAELAALPQVVCKFSGLLTETGAAARATPLAALDAVRPVWDQVLAWFGPARLLWGSDWPVLTLAGDYAGWVGMSEALSAGLSEGEQAGFWGDNACRFYGLGAPGNLP